MKKNYIMRIAALAVMCTIVTACFASTAFARYTSSGSGTGVVTAAKWSILVGTETPTQELADDVTFFQDKIVAPGDTETQDVVLTNDSEVDAKITIAVTPTANNITNLTATVGTVAAATGVTANADGSYTLAKGATVTLPVVVEWPIGDTTAANAADTADGKAQDTCTFSVVVTAEQVEGTTAE